LWRFRSCSQRARGRLTGCLKHGKMGALGLPRLQSHAHVRQPLARTFPFALASRRPHRQPAKPHLTAAVPQPLDAPDAPFCTPPSPRTPRPSAFPSPPRTHIQPSRARLGRPRQSPLTLPVLRSHRPPPKKRYATRFRTYSVEGPDVMRMLLHFSTVSPEFKWAIGLWVGRDEAAVRRQVSPALRCARPLPATPSSPFGTPPPARLAGA
jgi:hypothetical protein